MHAQNGIFDSILNTSSSPQLNDKQDGGQSALDPIGRSPFLPSWNLHKVDLFSAFISHLDDISSWNVHESASLFNLKEKKF